jgi:cytochrome c biogenesis protein CcdA
MRSTTALRIAVVAEIVFVVITITLSEVLEHKLPEELLSWKQQSKDAQLGPADFIFAFGFLGIFAVAIASWIGLLFLKKWAAWTYLAATAVGYLLFALLNEPHVGTSIDAVANDLATIAQGVILGLAFFSDALTPTPPKIEPPRPPVLTARTSRGLAA